MTNRPTAEQLAAIKKEHAESKWIEDMPLGNMMDNQVCTMHEERALLLAEVEALQRGRDIQKGNAERWEKLALTYKRKIERLRAAGNALADLCHEYFPSMTPMEVKKAADNWCKVAEEDRK